MAQANAAHMACSALLMRHIAAWGCCPICIRKFEL